MQVKITEKILSITPYLSTSWSRIAALHMKGGVMAVTLIDGDTVNIPGLSNETIELIFMRHAAYLDNEQETSSIDSSSLKEESLKSLIEQTGDSSLKFVFGSPMDGLSTALQHDPSQANAADLPAEVLQKISAISKIIIPADELSLPKAEPFCNCFHCQIARAMNADTLPSSEELIEEVSDADLQFQEWVITQTGEQLFSVASRLNEHEKYNVYLGQPVGCTCGKAGCEHILAVLKS